MTPGRRGEIAARDASSAQNPDIIGRSPRLSSEAVPLSMKIEKHNRIMQGAHCSGGTPRKGLSRLAGPCAQPHRRTLAVFAMARLAKFHINLG